MIKKIGIVLFLVFAAQYAGRPQGAAPTILLGLAFAQLQEDGQPCPPECITDSMEIVTWYPSPYNEYEELRLYPKFSADESSCDSFDKLGLMYYNKDEQALKVCWQSPDTLMYSWEKITLGQGGNETARKILFVTNKIFEVPEGVNVVYVTMVGGGGGGGGAAGGYTGGGGGGGGSIINWPLSVTTGNTYNITVGSGGGGGYYYTIGSCNGLAGGNSSFGTLLSAAGGREGSCGSITPPYNGPGGSGGVNSVGGIRGSDGERGSSDTDCRNGDSPSGGRGGNSAYGKGGIGGCPYSARPLSAATGYGSGGAGGTSEDNIAGSGASGFVVVSW